MRNSFWYTYYAVAKRQDNKNEEKLKETTFFKNWFIIIYKNFNDYLNKRNILVRNKLLWKRLCHL